MAVTLQTPSILPITPFDPSNSYKIEFVYSDVQPEKNRVVITDNDTGSIVYDSIQQTRELFHLLPANTLATGKKYLVQLQVYDADNNSSNLSDATLFLCLSTPEFAFSNINDEDIYSSANITLELNYSQAEGEQLKNYQIIKYNAFKIQIETSNTIYLRDDLSYTFNGLEDNSTYYFRAIGETQNGIPLDTGYVKINTQFVVEPLDTAIQLVNDYQSGTVRLTFNIKNIHYTLEGDDYSFADGMVTLNNTSVTYDDGFSATDDFSLFCQANKIALGEFLELQNGLVTLSALKVCEDYYCQLAVKNSDFKKYVKLEGAYYSDNRVVLASETSYITFKIIRKNGYYDLEIL